MTYIPSHDSRYYENAASLGINRRLSHAARVRNYNHFVTTMCPTESTEILDVGTCDEITEEANMLQQLHPHRARITCTSIGMTSWTSRYLTLTAASSEPRAKVLTRPSRTKAGTR